MDNPIADRIGQAACLSRFGEKTPNYFISDNVDQMILLDAILVELREMNARLKMPDFDRPKDGWKTYEVPAITPNEALAKVLFEAHETCWGLGDSRWDTHGRSWEGLSKHLKDEYLAMALAVEPKLIAYG